MTETLEDHLRRVTRHFTTPLGEDEALRLGRDLALDLAAAHAETPPRVPELEPAAIAMADGRPRLGPGRDAGDVSEDLFRLGALVHSLVAGSPPQVSWRLDGPPSGPFTTVARRAAVMTLAAPRRGHRFSSAAEAAAAMDAALAPPPEGPAPWPVFRGSHERSGAAAGPLPAGLAQGWDARLGAAIASPVVTGAFVLLATNDGRLMFVDRRSGRRAHEIKLASAIESTPTLHGACAYLGTDDGELVAVDVTGGHERYRLRLGKLVRSSPLPVADGDRVVVGVVDARSQGAVVVLDAAKGKPVWSRKTAAVFSSPARAGRLVLFGSDDGALHALDAATGAPAWSRPVGGKVRATPAVAGGIAFVGGFGGRFVAVRVDDGSLAWSRDVGHPIYSSACLTSGAVVFGCNEGHVHGLDRATGEPRFAVTTRGPVVSSPAGWADRLLIASTDGDVYLLGDTGEVKARLPLSPGGVQASPAVDAPHAYLASADGLHAIGLVP